MTLSNGALSHPNCLTHPTRSVDTCHKVRRLKNPVVKERVRDLKGAFRWFTLGVILMAGGCTNAQLRISTLNQGATLADIQYQMVLRNLACFTANPSAIPWHVSITAGTAQVADAATAHSAFLAHFPTTAINRFFEWDPGVTGSRTIVQQWSTNPIVHTDALKVLQMAYRRGLGFQDMPDQKLLDDVAHDIKKQIILTEDLRTETGLFYQSQFARLQKSYDSLRRGTKSTVGDQQVMPEVGADPDLDRKSPLAREVVREVNDIVEDLQSIPTGWFGVGRWHDVPKDACYVAHEGKVYVWVTKDHRDDLSKFTMAVLDIATAIQEPETLNAQGSGLSFSPGFTAPQ
jgi:hypothetical protein